MVYKKILVVILAAMMAVTLVGCDSHSNITESVSTETEERYSVKLHIEFPSNLLLSKYDVDVKLDGKKQGTLAHGNDGDFEFQLTLGEHTLTFSNEKASSVKGEVKFNISGDTELGYKIGCHSDRIDVEEKYSVGNSVSENESSAPISSDDVRKKDYQELETLFKNAGFTNITTEPLYDIVFGITKEGETESISIDGKTEFKYGDVFNKDTEVRIVYHLKAENDPSRHEDGNVTESDILPESSIEDSTSLLIESSSEGSSEESSTPPIISKPAESSSASSSEKPVSSKPAQVAPEVSESEISLVSMTNPLRRNEDATITIKGKPNTQYSITVYYKSGKSTAKGLESKISNSDGVVSWTWHIGGKTQSGDKGIVINGGGQTLKLSFTIVDSN